MATSVKFKFSGHQTFPFRYGWLEKGVRGVSDCPTLFSEDDAIVRLGVGKNMVDSIRHWCQVAQLVATGPDVPGSTGRELRVTDIGRRLLLDNGWDPFLEDDASLWLIHWLIVTNPHIGTAWQLLFSRFHRPDFTRRELADFIAGFVQKEGLRVGDNVIARDIDCLVRCYATSSNGKKVLKPEETFECPLLQLNLIQLSPDGELYRFSIGPKPSLAAPIVAFAVSQYLDSVGGNARTLSLQKCLYGEGSPGQAFKLDENSLIAYLEELEEYTGHGMMLDETAGMKQIFRMRTFNAVHFLNQYYGGGRLA